MLPFQVGPTGWAYDVYDVATQATSSNYVWIVDGHATFRSIPFRSIPFRSIPFRYVWPSELDLMARLAGRRLRGRWDGWNRAPFTSESRQHVSVWEKPAG
ncbi:hypothetical protein ACFY2R_15600 [Micromonospora olivasterospora]|uniref:Uncharacterized protein n=1 Tax=Micromonospora olivasterospora TaxID=1880 RepID=A0A562IGQ4_MICOL|nr:hypothetical protein [Micromonospora olivasterospora]TWH70211.1 hypothetical protein JD77_05232 [Micromonospora olivasterospora]